MAQWLFTPYLSYMKKIIALSLTAAIATVASLGAVSTASAATLDRLKSEKRVILLFAKSRSTAGLDQQVDILRNFRPEMRERNLIVLRTTGSEETRSAIGYTSIQRGTARELRDRFKPVGSGMNVILVGKDGTEKGRWQRVVQPNEFFELIDSMPMRKQEMNDQSATN